MILKLIHRLIICIVLIGLFLTSSKIISYYKIGAKQTSIFQESLNDVSTSINTTWKHNDISVEYPNITFALSNDINSAWNSLNKSIHHQTDISLSDYFHEEMIEKIQGGFLTDDNKIIRHDISHELELKHLSLDRSVAVVKDHKCVLVHRELKMNDSEVNFTVDTISYTAILVFSDGKWKLKNWIQEKPDIIFETRDDPTTAFDANLSLIEEIRGINYYAQEYPWHYFWDSITSDIINTDFEIIKDLGLNTVRIFIPYQTFSQSGKEDFYLQKLHSLMDVAATKDLRIMPTLFDFPVGFDLSNYQLYTHHLNIIITDLRDHPALLAWNIKNEPDLDFEYHGKQKVIDWLDYTIKQVRYLDPHHPLTASWSRIDQLPTLAEKLDFLSFHLYTDELNWTKKIEDYRSRFKKPIVLEEFGVSTRLGMQNILGSSETHQRKYITQVIAEAKSSDIPWMLWTLYDFRQIPKGVFKARPWIKSKQSHFGLIRKDGSKKELFNHFMENDL